MANAIKKQHTEIIEVPGGIACKLYDTIILYACNGFFRVGTEGFATKLTKDRLNWFSAIVFDRYGYEYSVKQVKGMWHVTVVKEGATAYHILDPKSKALHTVSI